MTWRNAVLGSIVVLVLIVTAAAILLPGNYRAEATAKINVSRLAVWAVIADVKTLPERRSDIQKVKSEPDSANGATVWQEEASGETRTMQMTESMPLQELTMQAAPGSQVACTRIYRIKATDPESCTVTIQESGTVHGLISRAEAFFGSRGRILRLELKILADQAERQQTQDGGDS